MKRMDEFEIDAFTAELDKRVRDVWGGRQHFTMKDGFFFAPVVREGGHTDLLIKMAVEQVESMLRGERP